MISPSRPAAGAAFGRVRSLSIAAIRDHPGGAWALGALAAALAFGHLYLNYDSFYALVWGRDLVHGRGPDYDLLLAPTPHPLLTLAGMALTPLGDAAPGLMSAGVAVCWALLIAAVYLLGARLFGPWAGAVAAIAVATREPLASWAVRGFVDVPFMALVAGAAALEARRPRAGGPVLALLGLAGLLRPEAWALAGLYWLWLWPALDRRGRAAGAALAAIGPLGWAAFDLIGAGDPAQSLTGTRENVEILGRRTGLDDVPYAFARWLGYLTREPGVVGAAGAVAAVLWLRERAWLPAAIFWAGGATFAVYGLAGLPLISRYLTVPALMLAVFCGAAVAGWVQLDEAGGQARDGDRTGGGEPRSERGMPPRDELRRRWRALGLAAALILIALFPFQIDRLAGLRDRSAFRERIQGDLEALTEDPAAGAALAACPRVYVPNHRPVPLLAWWLDRPPRDFVSAQLERPARGAFVAPASERVAEAFVLDRRDPGRLDAEVPPSFRRVTANRSWVLYERC